MEYLNKDDYSHIKDIIDEFIGDTVLGNHLFKAIRVHFKRKEREIAKPKAIDIEINNFKPSKFNSKSIHEMSKEADEALLRFNKKLRRKNVVAKGKKKTNN